MDVYPNQIYPNIIKYLYQGCKQSPREANQSLFIMFFFPYWNVFHWWVLGGSFYSMWLEHMRNIVIVLCYLVTSGVILQDTSIIWTNLIKFGYRVSPSANGIKECHHLLALMCACVSEHRVYVPPSDKPIFNMLKSNNDQSDSNRNHDIGLALSLYDALVQLGTHLHGWP